MKINVLTPEVYNRIAAGEVVDRPYSVVKELVENAIDAGASEIGIEIEGGGKKRIRVTDNGGGIERADLKSAFLPHATSKLRTADDLAAIFTLGFRGEAIASIASVSRMQILSKVKGENAYSLASEGGVLGEVSAAGGADGTQVTVEDLFFNTPARLKFLKSDASEESDVTNMVSRFILSRPEIAFTYSVNGKVRYRSFGDGLESALAVVYGAGVIESCFHIAADKHGIKLHGYIGGRNFSKPNRSYQSLFVNGRYVVNQTVNAAVTNAYGSYLMKRQYPFFVLFLDVPTEIVDVNVHPNKADVRFADNQIIYGSVYSVVSAVLDGNSRALEYLVNVPKVVEKEVAEQKSDQAERAGETVEMFADQSSSVQGELYGGQTEKKEFVSPSVPEMSFQQAKKELAFDLSPASERAPAQAFFFEGGKDVLEVRSPVYSYGSQRTKTEKEDVFAENKRFLEEQAAKQERIEPSALSFCGAIFQTYLIYESGEEAYLVDQHAAHERLIYNRLKEKCERRDVIAQPMLLPFLLTVNAQEFAFLTAQFSALQALGFEIGEFGDTSIKVSAVPVELFGMDLNAFFAEVLSSMETLRAVKLADIVKDKLASMACKAAVKGGEKLTEDEARALIAEMNGDMTMKCPHGRPAVVKITKKELEKLFKRIV